MNTLSPEVQRHLEGIARVAEGKDLADLIPLEKTALLWRAGVPMEMRWNRKRRTWGIACMVPCALSKEDGEFRVAVGDEEEETLQDPDLEKPERFPKGSCNVCGKPDVAAGRLLGVYLCGEHMQHAR